MNSKKPILLIEDDEVDILTVKRSFKMLGIENKLIISRNGEEGLLSLASESELPCLIILDINMPKMNGLEFIKKIKDNFIYKSIPVIIFTTSTDPEDKSICFNYGCAGYIVKPIDYLAFNEAIKTINDYWSLSQFAV